MKIAETDIFHEVLNEMHLPAKCTCISSESSQEDTVLSDEDKSVPNNGKYFHSFDYFLVSDAIFLNQFIGSFPILIS